MIKVMLILWYLIVGTLWLGTLCLIFDDAFEAINAEIRKRAIIEGLIPGIFVTFLFLAFALMPNFIGAVIQWIVSLFH